MLEDIKMEYKKIEKLKRQFYELINTCQQYVSFMTLMVLIYVK